MRGSVLTSINNSSVARSSSSGSETRGNSRTNKDRKLGSFEIVSSPSQRSVIDTSQACACYPMTSQGTYASEASLDRRDVWPGGGEFAETLAKEAAQLCMRLATEREMQLAQLHSTLVRERDRLQEENQRLSKELAARNSRSPPTTPSKQRPNPKSLAARLAKARSPERPASPESTSEARTSKNIASNDVVVQAAASEEGDALPKMRPSLTSATSDPAEGLNLGFEAHGQDLFVLRKVYKEIDRRRLGRVCAEDVSAVLDRGGTAQASRIDKMKQAIKAVNEAMEESQNQDSRAASPDNDAAPRRAVSTSSFWPYPNELSFEGFQWLILKEDVEDIFSQEVLRTVHEVREFYVKWTTESMILERTRVAKDELTQEEERSKVPWWLEPFIGVIILLNAVSIGLSQDLYEGSMVWPILECVFSAFFLLELIIKVYCLGPVEHFFGPGMIWSWFDFCIVAIAVLDVAFMIMNHYEVEGLPDLNTVTIVRLIRLVRMARLVRLLRMKVFKELTLMIYGVIGGLKTLCWAFVLLACLVYVIGVFMKQLFQLNNLDCSPAAQNTTSTCTESEELLYEYQDILFSSVYRSMFTVFRCLIGDCNAPNGTPLAPHLMDALGVYFAIGYVIFLCFVLFGVFNLVMAIFVENTLETARLSQQKRQQARTKEHVRVAQELRDIVLRICTRERRQSGQSVDAVVTEKTELQPRSFLTRMKHRIFGKPPPQELEVFGEETLQMAVSRKVFEEVLTDPKVIAILEDLEISMTSPSKLFDIIDSNGSGHLDVGEIIEGLMKLRGPADKGDVVCAALMVRNVQRELQRIEFELMQRHKVVQDSQMRILTSLRPQRCVDVVEEPYGGDGSCAQLCKGGFW